MFEPLVDQAKLRVSSAATLVAGRAAVGGLLLVGAGFGVAAAQLALASVVGAVFAALIMATLFVVMAMIVASVFAQRTRQQDLAIEQTSQRSMALTGLMTSSAALIGGFRMIRGLSRRVLGRSVPVVAIAAVAGWLLLSRSGPSGRGERRRHG